MNVYILPQAKLANRIIKHPDSVVIIPGDFNRANLTRELLKYRQHIRNRNILEHCYTTIKNAYGFTHAVLGLPEHCLVHLLPTYRQKLKSAKPTSIDYRDIMTSYSNFCEDMCVSTRIYSTYIIMINYGSLQN